MTPLSASVALRLPATGLVSRASAGSERRCALPCRMPAVSPGRAGVQQLRRSIAPVAAMRSSRDEVLSSFNDLEFSQSAAGDVSEQPSWWQGLVARVGQILGAAALALAVVVSMPMAAEAAKSSGRMGGSSFSRSSSPSYSASRAPRTTHSHSVVVAPSYGFGGFGFPSFGFGGFGMGSFLFPSYGYGMGGGVSIFSILFLALGAYMMFNVASSMLGSGGVDDADEGYGGATSSSGACSVVKLQVGLLGMARGLQDDLNKIAGGADTSAPEGLQSVLQETVLALLRNPDYCVYGGSKFIKATGLDNAEKSFNQMSLEERGKLKGETLSNYSGMSRQKASGGQAADMKNELIVVTLMVAVEGKLRIPEIMSLQELKDALSKLGSVGADSLLALEVLWTPQEEDDSFTQEELITDYPTLVAL